MNLPHGVDENRFAERREMRAVVDAHFSSLEKSDALDGMDAFSPNGQRLATADRNGGISVWDPDSAQEIFTLASHKSAVTALSWRGDSKLLASSSEDGAVKLWEMEEGKPVKSWTAHAAGALSVAYAQDDHLVTCGRDNAVTLWDGTGKKLRELEKCCDLPLRAGFSSGEERVFASDFAGRVMVWNVADGKRIGSLDANPPEATQPPGTAQFHSSK